MSASAALVSMHNAASQAGGDAFPVLKAFQDYLESERQRARNRMMTLSIVFAVVIVAVVGAFALFWYSSMHGVQDTNRQLLEAALKRANAEPPAPVVVQPAQPSAAETAKVIAEAVSKAQSDQSAVFAKSLEGLNASLESLRRDNAEMRAEIEREKAAAAKAAAEREAAEKAAAERAVAEEKARAAKEEAEKAAAQKAAAAKAVAQKVAAQKATITGEGPASSKQQTGEGPASSGPQTASSKPQTGEGPASSRPQTAPSEPPPLVIPKYDAPPPPTGFSQDVMAVRLQKEPRPISWRVYVPMRAE
jgi:flagellar basal body-associated protein FliL